MASSSSSGSGWGVGGAARGVASSGSMSSSGSSSGWMVGSTYFDYFSGKKQNEDVDTKVKDEYCLHNAAEVDKDGCKKPRSCSSCLRVAGCMVNSTGWCVSSALHYNDSLDFRTAPLFLNDSLLIQSSYDYWNASGTAQSSAVQNWIFPSTAVTYCDSGDATCKQCNSSIFLDAPSPDMRFCIGANACVCTALCESPALDVARQQAAMCDSSKAPKKLLPQPVMWIVGSSAALLVGAFLYWWMWRRTSDSYVREDTPSSADARYFAGKEPRNKSQGGAPGSVPSIHQVPHLDTPVFDVPMLEPGTPEFPRLSAEMSIRRPDRYDRDSRYGDAF